MNGLVLFFMVGCVVAGVSLLGSTLNRAKMAGRFIKRISFQNISQSSVLSTGLFLL